MKDNSEAIDMGRASTPGLVLGIDTCGPSGSVALARCGGGAVEILGQKELAGGSYSATLVLAVSELLQAASAGLEMLSAIVIVNGPGSFTGVRVGVSTAKGLAEGRSIRVIAVSRLEVLAVTAGVGSAALDAHRGEVFLRLGDGGELLAGKEELGAADRVPEEIAVCDDAAATLIEALWSSALIVRAGAPTAADAIVLAADRLDAQALVDTALLDGHYLRRSDAEIFGETGGRTKSA